MLVGWGVGGRIWKVCDDLGGIGAFVAKRNSERCPVDYFDWKFVFGWFFHGTKVCYEPSPSQSEVRFGEGLASAAGVATALALRSCHLDDIGMRRYVAVWVR